MASPDTFPGGLSPFRVGFLIVSLFIDGVWVPVSMNELGDDGVQIKRGRSGEGTQTEPSSCTFRLKDPTGKWSPRHPASPYFGKIGRGTPVKVEVQLDTGGPFSNRWQGEVVTWQSRWTRKGAESAFVEVECAGALRRIGQGAAPLQSPLRRTVSKIGTNLIAYWPMEDQEGATRLEAAIGGRSATHLGVSLAAYDALASSDPLPTLKVGSISATVPKYTPTSPAAASIRWVMNVPSGTPDSAVLLRVRSTGTMGRADVVYSTSSGGSLLLNIYNQNGSFNNNLFSPGGVTNRQLRCSLEMSQSGSDINADIVIYDIADGTDLFNGALPFTGLTLGAVSSVSVNPNRTSLGDVAFGHLSVEKTITPLLTVSADVLRSYLGEPAKDRIDRLCTENGLVLTPFAGGDVSAAMGAQKARTLPELLQECVDADGGILLEPRSADDLFFTRLSALYSRTGADKVTVAYVENMYGLEPSEDDSGTRNRVTVTREGGASATAEVTTGALGIDAVGIYDEAVTLSLATDDQPRRQAEWRVAVGTYDEARFPSITVDLADPRVSSDVTLRDKILSVTVGSLLEIADVPEWLPPFPVRQLVVGYTETITPFSFQRDFVCVPAGPYDVGRYFTTGGTSRYTTAGTVLSSSITTTATTVTTTVGARAWGHDDGDYDVVIGGERMKVTAVGVPTTTQNLTVVRSQNGIVKAHAAGTAVELAEPTRYGL